MNDQSKHARDPAFYMKTFTTASYVGKHLSLRGGIDFEGPWRDLGGELFGSGSPTCNHLIGCETIAQVARGSSYEV